MKVGSDYRDSQPGDFKDLVLENLFSITKNAAQLFDNLYRPHTGMFSEDLGHCFSLLNKAFNTKQVLDDPARWNASYVLWQAANSLIGAYQALRVGFASESALIIRYTLELQAIAIAMFTSDDYLKKFVKGELSGNKSITPAKKIFPEIGSQYGLLSTLVHPTIFNVGNYLHRDDDGNVTLLIGAGFPDSSPRLVRNAVTRLVLAFIEYQSSMLHATIELVLFDVSEEHHYWQKMKNGFHWKPSPKSAQKWAERNAALEKVMTELGMVVE